MARTRKAASGFTMKELDVKEAKQQFSRSRGRGSMYDEVVQSASDLKANKALIVEGLTYSNVLGLRKRVTDHLGTDYKVESTKSDASNNLYDVLIHKAN